MRARPSAAGPRGGRRYQRRAKQAMDVCISVALLVLLLPIFPIIAIAVALRVGRPVLFRQRRIGRGGSELMVVKFRTMTDATNDAGELLPDDDRMTSFGRFLRRTSLDETPQLVSVLFGEMSLVGPRPLPIAYRDLYTPEQFRRHLAQPGLTGLSAVRGRNAISWEEKLSLDVWYVDHWSLWLDVKILGSTIVNVLSGRGVSQPGRETVDPFLGS